MKRLHKLVALTICAVSTWASAADAVKIAVPLPPLLAGPTGRYIFGQISESSRDQYMFDSQTGRLWRLAMRKGKHPNGSETTGEGFAVLEPVPYDDMQGRLEVTPH